MIFSENIKEKRMDMKVLLAEDTKDLNKVITALLEHEQYVVDSVFDGEAALEHIKRESYDAIILDIMMPKMNGLETLKTMRELHIVTPVLLLTAKSEVDDRVTGLETGADDYLTKPFAMKELLARVRSMTRRHNEYAEQSLRYEDLELDVKNFELSARNAIRLSIKEFELMQTLILNANRELDTDYLLGHVWKNEPDAKSQTVWLYISYLKGKLSSIASKATIEGECGGSYRLVIK